MNHDSPLPREGPDGSSSAERRAPRIETNWYGSGAATLATYTFSCDPGPPEPEWLVEHDVEQRVFRLTAPGGKTEVFRDQALRYLVVEPDDETGELMPVIRDGQPRFLCLCREEREAR